jgi:uncharacterized protein YqeY
MGLKDQVMADIKTAMKEKASAKLNALRFLQSAFKNKEIELRPNAASEDDFLGVLKKLVKQRKESIEQFQSAGRADLVAAESAELKLLETYLPAQLSREQVEAVVGQVIAALGAKTIKDMGSVMKEVVVRTSGAADNKLISDVVKAKLQ